MITVQDAEKFLNIDRTKNEVASVSESTNYFIFNVVPIDSKNELDRPLKAAYAIEKATGRKLAFNPMRFDRNELKSIKKIR